MSLSVALALAAETFSGFALQFRLFVPVGSDRLITSDGDVFKVL